MYTHIVKSVAYSSCDKIIRLAMLFHDIEKPGCFTVDSRGVGHFYGHQTKSANTSSKILKQLRAENKTISQVHFLIKYHDTHFVADKKVARLVGDMRAIFLALLLTGERRRKTLIYNRLFHCVDYIRQISCQ